MTRRITAYLALPILLLAAGCGNQTAAHNDPDGVTQPSDPTEVQAAIATRHQRWAGTADDRQAAQVVRADALNGEYAACMQAKGHAGFDFRHQIQMPLEAPDSGLIGLLEPFGQQALRDEALAVARGMSIEHRSNHPETEYPVWNEDVEAAVHECRAESRSASDDELDRSVQPAGLDELYGGWYADETVQEALLFDIENASDYATCMQTHGFGDGRTHEADEADEASATLMGRLRREVKVPAPEDWRVVNDPAARDSDPEWSAFLTAEQQWLDADEQCRTDLVAESIAEVWALQQDFEAEYADLISTVEQGWAAIREDAAALGWTPDKPFAA